MKKVLFLLLCSILASSAFTQQANADSLKSKLMQSANDSNKVNVYEQLSWHYMWSYPDSALNFSLHGLQLAQKLNFKKG